MIEELLILEDFKKLFRNNFELFIGINVFLSYKFIFF